MKKVISQTKKTSLVVFILLANSIVYVTAVCSNPDTDRCFPDINTLVSCNSPYVLASPTSCALVCNPGGSLLTLEIEEGGSYYDIKKCFYGCQQFIRNCSECSDLDQCTKCEPNFLVFSGGCLKSCPISFFDDGTGACGACHDSCKECNGPGDSQCTRCYDHYALDGNNRCQKSVNCPAGQYFNPSTGTCGVGCGADIMVQDPGICIPSGSSCPDSMILNGAICERCPAGEKKYLETCIPACEYYMFPISNRECKECNGRCDGCYDHSEHCLKCIPESIGPGPAFMVTPFKKLGFNCVPEYIPTKEYIFNSSYTLPCHESCERCTYFGCDNSGAPDSACYPNQVYDGILGTCEDKVAPICPPNSFIDGSNLCQPCDLSCDLCEDTGNDKCIGCSGGMLRSDPYATSSTCVLAAACPSWRYATPTGCRDLQEGCLVGTDDHTCSSCDPVFFLYDSECYWDSCPYDEQYENGNICYPCDFPCKTCDPSASTTCTSCQEGYELVGTTCLTICPPGKERVGLVCQDCGLGQLWINKKCYTLGSCPAGFYRDSGSVCKPCTIQLYGITEEECLQCHPLREYQEGTCVNVCGPHYTDISRICHFTACTSPCKTCKSSNLSQCLTCDIGGATPILHNAQCLSTCPDNFYENPPNSCTACDPSCLTCTTSSANSCLSCQSNLVKHGNTCLTSCPPSFVSQGGICVQCLPPQFINEGNCISDCPQGFQKNPTTNTCEACQSNEVWFEGECSTNCPTLAQLALSTSKIYPEENYCTKECAIRYYKDSNFECQKCPKNCAICSLSQPSNTVSCKATQMLIEFKHYFEKKIHFYHKI